MANLYTCSQIAERYHVKPATVWGWIRKKKLPAQKIGKQYLVREEELHRFEKSQKLA
ncbi:MAG TPA: helix-turn-helix domain-containing protein [Firmicutes bacterium]|nr:helix-turn-helix domain-containing protein [Bacillota bacterium]